MERVTAESTVDDLRRQRKRVEKWPPGRTRERVLEALDEWIAQKTLAPHALFSRRLTVVSRSRGDSQRGREDVEASQACDSRAVAQKILPVVAPDNRQRFRNG
jgi:hypothetical protein